MLGSMSSVYQAGDYFSRIYTGLSSTHTMVYFAYSFWQIDSWNGSPDYFQVSIDGAVITGWNTFNFGSMTTAQKVQVCGMSGSSYPDVVDTRTFGRVAHTGTSLTFKMISQCDQDSTNESLGFRELTILVVENPTTTGATQAFCGLSSLISLGTTWQCSCSEGQYLDSTSTCVTCDSSCSSCFGSGSNQCYECATGYSFNGTDCFSCASHCTACSGNSTNECYECESGYLLYNNNTCVVTSECSSPLYQDNCNSTCDSPCGATEYIYANLTCADYCEYPLQTEYLLETLLCVYPCNSTEYYYPIEQTCKSYCDGTNITINDMYQVCYSANTTIKSRTFSKLLHHIRYVDVGFPEKIANISIMRGTNILSLRVIPSMFAKVVSWPPSFTLPDAVFQYYNLPSTFLANFADDFILLGMILTAIFLAFFLENMFSCMECLRVKTIFQRLRIMIQWNLPLMLILQNTGDIFFFAVLEWRSLDVSSAKSSFSFFLSIFMILLLISLYGVGVYLSEKAQIIKKEQKTSPNPEKNYIQFITQWEKYQVLFRGYDNKSIFTQSFFLIYCLRWTLPMVVASFLYDIPLLQSITFFVLTIWMIIYLAWRRPIRRKIDLINLIAVEFLVLLVDSSLLGLTILDMKEKEATSLRSAFGEIIIVCDYCIYYLPLLFLVIKSFNIIHTALNFRKKQNIKQEKTTLLQFFFLPLQQGNFGFEQFQIDSFETQPQHNESVIRNKLSTSELRRLPSMNSMVSQTTMVDFNNSNLPHFYEKRNLRRVIPQENSPPVREDSHQIIKSKKVFKSKATISGFWTEAELHQSRPNASLRHMNQENRFELTQEWTYSSVRIKNLKSGTTSGQTTLQDFGMRKHPWKRRMIDSREGEGSLDDQMNSESKRTLRTITDDEDV